MKGRERKGVNGSGEMGRGREGWDGKGRG